MITYSTTHKFILGVAALTIASLVAAKCAKDMDQLRIALIIIAAAGIVFMFVYAVCFPTYFGYFIKVVETEMGFDLEYLNKYNAVQRIEKIDLKDLISFSCFDHSSQVLTRTRFIFRSSGSVTKLTLVHKKRVKGVELQTTEIIDGVLGKIAAFNQQGSPAFIERTPSFLSSKAGLYTTLALVMMLGFAVASSPAKTEKLIIALFSLVAITSVLMLRRWNELKQVAKSNKRPLNIA
ncbi:hypothetical protein ACTJIJ_03505 [Niabella sp. 22666]|uniref:hypothetical protein n=1 Tax=Niabella sp. 22666 TaxID=3453954 RepID=UPI003F8454D0